MRRFLAGRPQLYRNVLERLPVVSDDFSMTCRIQPACGAEPCAGYRLDRANTSLEGKPHGPASHRPDSSARSEQPTPVRDARSRAAFPVSGARGDHNRKRWAMRARTGTATCARGTRGVRPPIASGLSGRRALMARSSRASSCALLSAVTPDHRGSTGDRLNFAAIGDPGRERLKPDFCHI